MKRNGVLAILVGSGILIAAGEDKAPVSVWDGIYSAPQAARGASAYREECASCHGAKLEGKGATPPLSGDDFATDWDGMAVGDLFEKIQLSMPADRPGQLSELRNAEIVAYILQFNKFPAGTKELPASADALRGIRFETERPSH
jgi:cytochrome c